MALDLTRKKKIGLVLSGGAVKAAAFHVGVAMALENRGFRFAGGLRGTTEKSNEGPAIQVYVGSSAGSLLCTYLAQGNSLPDIVATFEKDPKTESIPGLKYWELLNPRVRGPLDLIGFDNFFLKMLRGRRFESPFSTEGISKYLKSHVLKSDSFRDLNADLFIVATELNSSRKAVFSRFRSLPLDVAVEYRNDVAISDACAASMSLPPLYHPCTLWIEGQRRDYYDGEIREPLSQHVAREAGCDLIITSYTHQPVRVPRDKKSLADRGVQHVVLQGIYQAIEQKIQSARETRRREKQLLDSIRKFFVEKELPMALADELNGLIEERLSYKSNLDYIYIAPRPSDFEFFSEPHFSLNRKKTERIVRKGFLAASSALRGLSGRGD